jgi:hypothetical protein
MSGIVNRRDRNRRLRDRGLIAGPRLERRGRMSYVDASKIELREESYCSVYH